MSVVSGVNLAELLAEFKELSGRKKAGEVLPAALEARRQELKAILRTAVEAGGLEPPSKPPAPASVPPAAATPSGEPIATFATTPVAMPVFAPVAAPQRLAAKPDLAASIVREATTSNDSRPALRPSTPGPAPATKPFAARNDFFAIDAAGLIDAAARSEAVAKVDPFAHRKAQASVEDLVDAEEKAEAALSANKKPERARSVSEAVAQLKNTPAAYTPPEESIVLEQYYGDFVMDGYQPVDMRNERVSLKPIDSAEIEFAKLSDGAMESTFALPPGLAFLDDFPALYARRIVPAATDEVVVDSTDSDLLIPGKRRVTVHLLSGERRQGAIRSLRRGELGFKLEPLGTGPIEELSISQVKAVFVHLQSNAPPKDGTGRAVTATFSDGRAVQGQSDDYVPGSPVFTLIPPAGRGQFERIIVNAAAVKSVT